MPRKPKRIKIIDSDDDIATDDSTKENQPNTLSQKEQGEELYRGSLFGEIKEPPIEPFTNLWIPNENDTLNQLSYSMSELK